MDMLLHDPADGIYASTADYAHATELRDLRRIVLVSGTMGLDEDGVPGGDLDAQLRLVWANIARILADADMGLEHVVRVTSYLTDAAHADRNAAARVDALGGRVVPTTAIVVRTLDPEWLVEIEVFAAS